MSYKTVSISARISQEDAEFLSQLTVAGAKTPSEKLRAILTEARQRHLEGLEYPSSLQLSLDTYLPLLERIQKAEYEAGVHSELLTRLMHWLPEMAAYVVSGMQCTEEEVPQKECLSTFEQGAGERIFRLMESILQLGVTQQSPCYNPGVINDRVQPILELADVIARLQKPSS